MANGLRGMLGKHFGEENVLWVIGEGPEPSPKRLREMTETRRNEAILARQAAIEEKERAIRATERVIAGEAPGGLTEQEWAFLPELLRILRREKMELEQSDLRNWMR